MKIFQSALLQKLSHWLLVAVVIFASSFPFFQSASAASATDYGVGRTRSCDSDGNPSGLDFDPTTGGKDVEFSLSNPVCLTVIAITYAWFKLSIANMNRVCGSGSVIPRPQPSPISDSIDIAKAAWKAPGNPSCQSGIAGVASGLVEVMAVLGTIYAIAYVAYKNTSICGANWMKPNPSLYDMSAASYKQTVDLDIEGYIRDDQSKLTLDNQTYREWYYGGVEVSDDPAASEATCLDPTKGLSNYSAQKYYLKGLEAGNFNCEQYYLTEGQNDPVTNEPITTSRLSDFQTAYKCCLSRSQSYICIDYSDLSGANGGTKFCRSGSLCTIGGITFSTKSLDDGRLVCAETYSLCPYNFSIGGGSEYCDYYQDGTWSGSTFSMITQDEIDAGQCSSNSEIREDDCTYNDKSGKCKNYCQYLVHCTTTSSTYEYTSSLESPYFSDACMNFVGDSQNSTAYNGGIILGSQRHFSAPIAQCVKETLENVFYNVAGHSKCLNVNEYPSSNGVCPSGEYATDGASFVFKKGNGVKETSFFSTVQNVMQDIVKMVLTLSITFYGVNILLGKNDIRVKKDILVYIVKIGMVLYFSTGDAWQSMFFNGVYGASSAFSQMVFKIEANNDDLKRDGCQFGKIVLITDDDTTGVAYDTGRNYPSGKEYLALWDTLDCKIARYLGFGPEASVANIAALIFAGYFTGAVGLYFAIALMFLGFFFISATVRALHIFLSSALSIIIMVFVSPIIIPCCLFAKTSDIYKKWLTNLISFCLQPMILFAYVAVLCTVIDKSLIGSAIFVGDAPAKTISCTPVCQDADGNTVDYVDDVPPDCDETGQVLVDPMDDSVACMITTNSFGNFPGLEIIGINLPVLTDVLDGNPKQKILTILRGALVMYLLYKFMDEIPGITTALIGGQGLPRSAAPSALDMFSKTAAMSQAAVLRAGRAATKLTKRAGEGATKTIREMGKKGKDTQSESGASGGDHSGGGGGSGGDDTPSGAPPSDSAGGGGGGGNDSGN